MDSSTILFYAKANVNLPLDSIPITDLTKAYADFFGNARWDEYTAKAVDLIETELTKRNFDPNIGGGVDRDKLPASDFVDPVRRRFPIVIPEDIIKAARLFGQANPPIPMDQFRARVVSIARRKGPSFVAALPKSWNIKP